MFGAIAESAQSVVDHTLQLVGDAVRALGDIFRA